MKTQNTASFLKPKFIEYFCFGKSNLVDRQFLARVIRNWRADRFCATKLIFVRVRSAVSVYAETVHGQEVMIYRYCTKPKSPFNHQFISDKLA